MTVVIENYPQFTHSDSVRLEEDSSNRVYRQDKALSHGGQRLSRVSEMENSQDVTVLIGLCILRGSSRTGRPAASASTRVKSSTTNLVTCGFASVNHGWSPLK